MSTALAVFHGCFGRAALYRLNKPLAPHAHREGHLIFHVEGQPGTLTIDDVPHVIDPGNGVAISPWEPHDFRPGDWASGSVFLTLYIAPSWFLEMSPSVGGAMRFGAPRLSLTPGLSALAARVSAMMADGHMGADFPAILHELVVNAFEESWAVSAPDRALTFPRIGDYRIRNAMRLMNERVTDTCVLDRIARDAGLSRPHFYKLFRQNVGLTPNMYLNTLRLERSIERLTRSDDPVTSIGLDLGFASQASFTRFFSNNIGIAPSDYRRASVVAA